MSQVVLFYYGDGEQKVSWLRCEPPGVFSNDQKERGVILEGKETGDPRNLYCNILRGLPNSVLTLVDSDMQGEVGPEAEVPREKTVLAIW